jgi:penicillin-binding protein-related factor A (putative recombinase)
MTEAQLTHQIINALNRFPGVMVWRANTGAIKIDRRFVRFGVPGQADITGVYHGRRVEIEVKKPGKLSTLTDNQRAFLESIKAHGGVVAVVTSLDEAMDALGLMNY